MALSSEAMELLVQFRQLGNPGDLHPNDRERWRKFVIQAHEDGGEILEADVIDVIEDGWSHAMTSKLGADYCYAREPLRCTCEGRADSPSRTSSGASHCSAARF